MVVVGVKASTEEGDDEEEDATSTSAAANVDALHFIIYLFLIVYFVSLLRSKLQTIISMQSLYQGQFKSAL